MGVPGGCMVAGPCRLGCGSSSLLSPQTPRGRAGEACPAQCPPTREREWGCEASRRQSCGLCPLEPDTSPGGHQTPQCHADVGVACRMVPQKGRKNRGLSRALVTTCPVPSLLSQGPAGSHHMISSVPGEGPLKQLPKHGRARGRPKWRRSEKPAPRLPPRAGAPGVGVGRPGLKFHPSFTDLNPKVLLHHRQNTSFGG